MKILSAEEQIARLRPTVRTGVAHFLPYGLLGGAALLMGLSILWWHPVPLIIALFLCILGIFERHAGPNLDYAIKAYDKIRPTSGEVTISVTSWDGDDHYRASVREQGQPDWAYPFIPQGWRPAAGRYPAKIWRADRGSSPILVTIENGLLIPREKPKRIASASPGLPDD